MCVCKISTLSGWWSGTFFIFPYIGNNHPNWLSYFSEGWPNHQPVIICLYYFYICSTYCGRSHPSAEVRISSNPKLHVDLRRLWLYLRPGGAGQEDGWRLHSGTRGIQQLQKPYCFQSQWIAMVILVILVRVIWLLSISFAFNRNIHYRAWIMMWFWAQKIGRCGMKIGRSKKLCWRNGGWSPPGESPTANQQVRCASESAISPMSSNVTGIFQGCATTIPIWKPFTAGFQISVEAQFDESADGWESPSVYVSS